MSCSLAVCFDTPGNESFVCSGNGKCGYPNVCTCESGWHGPTCHLFNCYGRVNSDRDACGSKKGECVGPNQCNCTGNYIGSQCNDWMCNGINASDINNTMICSGLGKCISPNLCYCDYLVMGNNCDQYVKWKLILVAVICLTFFVAFSSIIVMDCLLFSAVSIEWNPMRKKKIWDYKVAPYSTSKVVQEPSDDVNVRKPILEKEHGKELVEPDTSYRIQD
jgi:hypothetical protein